MNHDNFLQKKIRLGDELDNSIKQIIYGLKELQISFTETSYYFISFQLLASGIERLLKCSICYGYLYKHNKFPQRNEIKTHDIEYLLNKFIKEYFKRGSIEALNYDYEFLTQNVLLKTLIKSLSDFGQNSRYYNLNVITGDLSKESNVEDIWNELINKFIETRPDLKKKLFKEYDFKTLYIENSNYFVSCFEKFVRAIVRQFTLGDMGEEPGHYIGTYNHFISLSDDKIGTTIYYDKFFKKENNEPIDYTSFEFDNCKKKNICKENYNGLWPFKNTNSVIVQNQQNNCLTIVINKRIYALNGTAKQVLKIPTPFEKDEAFVGRSLTFFIDIASKL